MSETKMRESERAEAGAPAGNGEDGMHPHMGHAGLTEMSSLALAHMGDAVYELLIRTKLCTDGLLTSDRLHRRTVELVCAPAQARAARAVLPLLSPEEEQVFRRGRNAKPRHVPHAVPPDEYGLATALEALFGYLYLAGRHARIGELFCVCSPAQAPAPEAAGAGTGASEKPE